MDRILAKDRQTLLDLQLIACGSLDGIIDTCARNDLSITEELADGQEIDVVGTVNKKVVVMYGNKGYQPATAISGVGAGIKYGGIGYMAIGVDFVIS